MSLKDELCLVQMIRKDDGVRSQSFIVKLGPYAEQLEIEVKSHIELLDDIILILAEFGEISDNLSEYEIQNMQGKSIGASTRPLIDVRTFLALIRGEDLNA